jgi:glycosyltransferase involved in cell wall biosynthesis
MSRYCLIGPTYPFRGGIAHYTTLLAQELKKEHELLLISFTRQYPAWLFPGKSDRDPSQNPLQTEAEYLLDPLNPLSWRRTLQKIAAWRAEVVVIPWWVPFWAPAWSVIGRGIKRQPQNPRLIYICHNVLPHEKSRVDKVAIKTALAPADGYVVHSKQDAGNLRALFPEAKIRVSPLPTYASLGQIIGDSLPADIPSDRPLILFCGIVREYKGLDILLDAMPLILAEREVHLLVAGEFWDDKEGYLTQIDNLGLDRHVSVVDRYLANEELAACIQACDVVVLPYRSATQSGIVQAAFGQGKPVITTNVGGLPEAVDNGRTGLLVQPEDPEALAEAIRRFFVEDLVVSFKENISQQQERFSWDRLTGLISELVSDDKN